MLLVQSPLEVDRVMALSPKAYAIQSASTTPPVSFHEGREVLHRLAARYWPGPLPMYLSTCKSGISVTPCQEAKIKLPEETLHQFPSTEEDCCFLGMRCPSHPLTGRVLNDVRGKKNHIVMGVGASSSNGHCLTKAHDVCQHLLSLPKNKKKKIVHVLNGEDKREAFVVPTCQYGQPNVGIWIHTRTRTVHIFSSDKKKIEISPVEIQRALSQSSNRDPKRQNRNRVVTAVLRKWRVVDHGSC